MRIKSRWWKLAAVLIVAATMAPFLQPSLGAYASSSSVSVTTTCGGSQLEVGVANGPASAGSATGIVLIANIGSRSCELKGYPRLRFMTATSRTVHVAISHATSAFKDVQPTTVRLQPGRVASFGVAYGITYNAKSDAARKCLVTTTYVVLGVHTYEIPFTWDACLSDMKLGVTAVESRAYPIPFSGR